MDVRGFAALIRIEETAIRSPTQNCRHAPHPLATLTTSPRKRGEVKTPHTGKLSCFLFGISTVFPFNIASARAILRLVECGMITSSIVPRSAAANGDGNRSSYSLVRAAILSWSPMSAHGQNYITARCFVSAPRTAANGTPRSKVASRPPFFTATPSR